MSGISDERREVAATLRDAKRKCDERGYPWMTDDLCLAIGYEHDYEADNGIFDRLADLMDPTCHVVPFDEESMRLPHCSKCGQPMLNPWPNFCPHCGARVVREGED